MLYNISQPDFVEAYEFFCESFESFITFPDNQEASSYITDFFMERLKDRKVVREGESYRVRSISLPNGNICLQRLKPCVGESNLVFVDMAFLLSEKTWTWQIYPNIIYSVNTDGSYSEKTPEGVVCATTSNYVYPERKAPIVGKIVSNPLSNSETTVFITEDWSTSVEFKQAYARICEIAGHAQYLIEKGEVLSSKLEDEYLELFTTHLEDRVLAAPNKTFMVMGSSENNGVGYLMAIPIDLGDGVSLGSGLCESVPVDVCQLSSAVMFLGRRVLSTKGILQLVSDATPSIPLPSSSFPKKDYPEGWLV